MRFGLLYEAQYVIPACRAEARAKPIPAGV